MSKLLNRKQIDEIRQHSGDAFYLLDMKKFQENFNDFREAFKTQYQAVNLAYSIKTNYIPDICREVKKMAGLAEVVSEMEIDLALACGFSGSEIIYNGPGKSPTSIKKALSNCVIINVDSLNEYLLIEKIRAEIGVSIAYLGIRVNISLDKNRRSRFGVDPLSNDFIFLIDLLEKNKAAKLVSLHTHGMAPERNAKSYATVARIMANLYMDLQKSFDISYLNLGGGFYSKMPESYQKQFDFKATSFIEYAEAIGFELNQRITSQKPILLLEPGIAITADIMDVYTKVMDIKVIGEKYFAYLNISKYDVNPTLHQKNLPVCIAYHHSANLENYENIDLTGNTCMEDDVIYRDFPGKFGIGDYIRVECCGAYTIVLKPNFIHPVLPVVLLETNGITRQIKSQEKMLDVFRSFNI